MEVLPTPAHVVQPMNLEGARALRKKVRLHHCRSLQNMSLFPRLWSVECARPDRAAAGLAGVTSRTTGCARCAA